MINRIVEEDDGFEIRLFRDVGLWGRALANGRWEGGKAQLADSQTQNLEQPMALRHGWRILVHK